jgi:VanZ family protein
MTSLILRGAAWLLLIAVAVFTLSPIQFRPVTAAPADVERFVAFALLGGVFCLAYPRQRRVILLLVLASAGVLEALQHVVPGRHGQVHDLLVKVVGAIAGAFGGSFVGQSATRMKNFVVSLRS